MVQVHSSNGAMLPLTQQPGHARRQDAWHLMCIPVPGLGYTPKRIRQVIESSGVRAILSTA